MSPLVEQPQSFRLPVGDSFYLDFMRTLREQKTLSFFAVLLVIFTAVKINQYLFFHFTISPAVVFVPTGIALAAVYLFGYRMWVPIAGGWFLGSLTDPSHLPLLVVVVVALSYALQAVVGGYVFARLKFSGTMGRTRDAIMLVVVAIMLPLIAPSIITSTEWFTNSLSAPAWTTWGRAWAGGVVNIMVYTPPITTWCRGYGGEIFEELTEAILALLSLMLVTYLIFWVTLSTAYSFLILYLIFAILFWIGLRLRPPIVATALFLTIVFGMAGSIIAHPGTGTLAQRLFSDELFVILIAPIFFILSALVEERRVNALEAKVRAIELEAVNRKLSLDDQAKNEFLATLAHELRNPLAPVVSSLELIKIHTERLSRPDLMELVDIADTHVFTLTHLLDDLLDISRISRKKFKLQKEAVDLRATIEHALRTVDALYKAKNHFLSVSMPQEKLWIEVDPLRLEQILTNLLNNAAKYTPPGGHIEMSLLYNKDRGLRLSIKDNGVGIELHMLRKIFEPFVQSSDSSAGLGIGLSLTKRLVELHGGEVWAESEGLGKGSDFIVVLPIVQTLQLPLTTPTVRRRKGFPLREEEKKPARTYNILIIDDNRAAAESLGKLLEHGGHTVSIVYDGPTGIEKMRVISAEVILLDIGLPGMDGYAVARKLREEYGQEPLILIALTGYGQDTDKIEAQKAGFNHHLTKPVGIIDVENLLAGI